VSLDAERSRIALAWAEDEAPAEEPAPAAPALVPDPAPEE
jgi:hypothetical protein